MPYVEGESCAFTPNMPIPFSENRPNHDGSEIIFQYVVYVGWVLADIQSQRL